MIPLQTLLRFVGFLKAVIVTGDAKVMTESSEKQDTLTHKELNSMAYTVY